MAEEQVQRPAGAAEETAEESPELGSVQIHQHVIATIARLTTLKVPGVAVLSPSFTQGLARLFGRRADDQGVAVRLDEDGVVLDLNVVLHLGVRIPHVAWQIQNDVRQAVQQMTGKNVKAVNVIIQSLQFPPGAAGREEGGVP